MQVDTSKYFSGGKWLKAGDVKNKSTFVIEGAEEVTVMRQGNAELTLILRLKDVDAAFGLNSTNMKRMIELWGSESDRWKGKKITLIHTMAQNPQNGNKMQKALRIL
jgi:hypothetical protein